MGVTLKDKIFKRFQYIVRHIVPFFPRREFIATLCAYYLDAYHGENNTDMFTDGEVDFLMRYLSKNKGIKVFDIGANQGNWCETVLGINPHAEVHCFEPNNSAFKYLVNKKFPANVICNNYGLGDKSETRDLHVFTDNSEWNSLFARPGEGSQSIQKVHIDTVMEYCSRAGVNSIEYMKIDVEGNELAVLNGAEEMLYHHKVHIIQFEYAVTFVYAGTKLKDIYELARRCGYDLYRIRPRGLIPVPELKPNIENFRNANYVMMYKDETNKEST
jgi:FkbM family methyltransferase